MSDLPTVLTGVAVGLSLIAGVVVVLGILGVWRRVGCDRTAIRFTFGLCAVSLMATALGLALR